MGKISELNIALSIKHLSIMLHSGLPLDAAIKTIQEQAEDKALAKAFKKILQDIKSGISVADSMESQKGSFSNVIISMIRTGEEGGSLEQNLEYLADYLKKNYQQQRKIKGALIYPLVILSVALAEIIGVVYFMLPKLDAMFASFAGIPEYTRIIMSSAKYIREHTIEILIGIVIVSILTSLFLRTRLGKIVKDNIAFRFPIISQLLKKNNLTSYSRTLGILLKNGIPLIRALEITAKTMDSVIYVKALADVHNQAKSGRSLAESLKKYKNIFPMTYIKMIEIGEQTGTLQENLFYLYDFYEEEVDEMTTNMTALLEPILLIFIGCVIGFLALIIIGPIFQLTSSIGV